MQQTGTTRTNQASVSAALAAANAAAHPTPNDVHVVGGPGSSLAEMAQSDLDAALQLLADRAQYITGAHGAAIALRRDGNKDMLCRASAGSNAPQIGALLSAEFGLSGESVRTKQPLRCDDTEQDARVNREVCRQMGIASVAVMPVVNDDEVLGVFELFSGRVNAFGERELSTLQRLSGMVETAVRLAETSARFSEQLMREPARSALEKETKNSAPEALPAEAIEVELESHHSAPHTSAEVTARHLSAEVAAAVPEENRSALPPPPPASSAIPSAAEIKKPLFWSASLNLDASIHSSAEVDQSHVPPVLRNLHKCQACGFPVSEGRVLCVECEEKKWRGQLRGTRNLGSEQRAASAAAPAPARVPPPPPASKSNAPQTLTTQMIVASAKQVEMPPKPRPEAKESRAVAQAPSTPAASEKTGNQSPLFGAGLGTSQSWFSANKYILGALLVVAAVVTAILLLR